MSVDSQMTAIANKIRAIRGTSGTLSLDDMATRLGEIETHVANAYDAIVQKGAELPGSNDSSRLAFAISLIPNCIQSDTKSISVNNNNITFYIAGTLKLIYVFPKGNITPDGTTDYCVGVVYDGATTTGVMLNKSGECSYVSNGFSWDCSGGLLTITTDPNIAGYFKGGLEYGVICLSD